MMTPPVTACPKCGTDLRTGARPRRRFSRLAVGLKKMIYWCLFLWVMLIAYQQGRIWQIKNERLEPGQTGFKVATDFKRLAAQHPILLRPYIAVYKAREAVKDLNKSASQRQRVLEELRRADIYSDQAALTYSQELTPGQRARMLRDLLKIMQEQSGGPAAADWPNRNGQ
ncbi:MAG: hypothetical protein LBP55_01865 [Candidatus Adiutrix sp.]|nr:hypothetical protein [Candidatus Adiutrix sp.]